jgi:hypothetical protein
VLVELNHFQNDDSGFGHAVEPDIRMPFSSPFISSVAFQVLRELNVPGDHQMVRDGLDYFVRSYDPSIGGWDPTGPRSDDFPHAPWWNYVPVAGRLGVEKRSNPGAEIVGYLHLYSDTSRADFTDQVTRGILETFDDLPDDMEVHAMMCFWRLVEMVPTAIADQLLPKLQRGVPLVTAKRPEEWDSYGGRPLRFA